MTRLAALTKLSRLAARNFAEYVEQMQLLALELVDRRRSANVMCCE